VKRTTFFALIRSASHDYRLSNRPSLAFRHYRYFMRTPRLGLAHGLLQIKPHHCRSAQLAVFAVILSLMCASRPHDGMYYDLDELAIQAPVFAIIQFVEFMSLRNGKPILEWSFSQFLKEATVEQRPFHPKI
jgi:hypothetical protein